jgi:hypothetical protein
MSSVSILCNQTLLEALSLGDSALSDEERCQAARECTGLEEPTNHGSKIPYLAWHFCEAVPKVRVQSLGIRFCFCLALPSGPTSISPLCKPYEFFFGRSPHPPSFLSCLFGPCFVPPPANVRFAICSLLALAD